jgi:hypothetical protein
MDLPSNSPQMFQLPQPAQINQQPGLAQGLASGVNQGVQFGQQQQALAQKQQELQMAKQQQTISQVDTLLKSGMNYPGMLPVMWPAIATRMNSLSPDYQLDPNTPPENLKNFATALSSISDGAQDKVYSLDQAHAATKQLIGQSFPPKLPPDVGQTAGTPSPTGQPITQGQPQQPPTGQPSVQGGAQPQPQASNPLTDFVAIKAQYDKANQLISQAPMEGPQSQEVLRKQLETSSLGLNYKKALDNLSQQYGEGQQNNRNQINQNNEMTKTAVSNFQSQGKEFNNVADNYSAFNHLIQLSNQMENQGADTTATVNAEKTALLNFAQMAYPGTGRPGNMEMLENMEKSGPVGTLIGQYLNRLDKGDIMTGTQIKGLRQSALALYQGREVNHSQLEKSYSQNLQQYGSNPQALLGNMRPSSVVSTSPLYPTQSSDQDPLIGHVRNWNGKKFTYLGGDKANQENWAPAGSNE